MKFRPGDLPQGDPTNPGTPVEWEDNRISNFLAWFSFHALPSWCQTPEHFTSRLTAHLFTDCPCCLLWRGIFFGLLFSVPLWLLILGLIYILFMWP